MTSQAEAIFWNDPKITDYFADKPPDPRIVDFICTDEVDHSQQRALDLGCGGGRHSELLARVGYETSSLDVSPAMLETTRRRLERHDLRSDIRPGSITAIPYPDGWFDIVVATGVLHQAKDLSEYRQATAELSRVMKAGAFVLLNVFTNAVWDEKYTVTSQDGLSVMTAEGLPQTLLPKATFIEIMEHSGLCLFADQGEDIKEENTGPRAVYRAFFRRRQDDIY